MKLNNKKQKKLKQNNFLKKIQSSLSFCPENPPLSLSLSSSSQIIGSPIGGRG
jgi:hypothetical protein